jgi:hypothetical protein
VTNIGGNSVTELDASTGALVRVLSGSSDHRAQAIALAPRAGESRAIPSATERNLATLRC